MTSLDATILCISALLAAFAVATGRGIGIAFIVFVSFCINEWAFKVLDVSSYESFYETGILWMMIVAAKDFVIIGLLSHRLRGRELLLMFAFIASCLFHQLCIINFTNSDVDNMPVYDLRFNFMQLIAALQIAGVAVNLTGGGNGGKSIKYGFHWTHNPIIKFLHIQTQKAFK